MMTRRESIQHAVHFVLSGIMMCCVALGVMRYEEGKRAAAGIASVAVPSLPPGGG
jgi:hypothetical protein